MRWDLPRPHAGDIWTAGDAVAFERLSHSRKIRSLTVIGSDEPVRALLDFAAAALPATVNAVSVEQSQAGMLTEVFGDRLRPGGDWDWMWTTRMPPVVDAERHLVDLDDDADARDILALNEIGNPTAESEPGTGITTKWLGARAEGRLVAAGAIHLTQGGAPHLTGIVVDPGMRGRQLGLALIAALTRWSLDRYEVCTLGMYADNDRARAVYDGLGYAVAHAWGSRRLAE